MTAKPPTIKYSTSNSFKSCSSCSVGFLLWLGVQESLGSRRAATIPARGGIMMNLAKAVLQLKNEREKARRKLEQLDSALSALAGLGESSGKVGRAQTLGMKPRVMSAAARKRIAAAQRARWAKWKAARRSK